MNRSTSAKPSTRDKILIAAATMLSEDSTARLSVRAVAAKAGVSTGSLRHHFPTQDRLRDAVLAGIYEKAFPGDPIHDTALPARERLVNCLRQILAPVGTGERARRTWATILETLITPEPTEKSRAAYLSIERQIQHRVAHWLSVLADEGALPAGDTTQRVRFLLTVVNGLAVERALPGSESVLEAETATLCAAVDSVLSGRGQ
jgi:AcrR family transcriptional regulator